jgi:uncharacterized protein (DUF1778 family)
MSANVKSTQLQIRVSPSQKAAIQRAARQAGIDMSAYVLARVLPIASRRFSELTRACQEADAPSAALAELNSWLASLGPGELAESVASQPVGLTPFLANYVAAMVEYACARRGVRPPAWARAIPPFCEPVFGSTLMSLRLHLLTHSPPPFRRRNIFIDATIGDRV